MYEEFGKCIGLWCFMNFVKKVFVHFFKNFVSFTTLGLTILKFRPFKKIIISSSNFFM
jgi:hypothetical protein